jgi:glycosyltransferase involved in cell wall biosynthesis
MKILMLAPLFYPHIGGVEKHVRRVSEELVKRGHGVNIVTVKHEQALPELEELNKVMVHRFPDKRLLKVWFWLLKRRELIKTADIIHCHDFSTFILWYLPSRFLYPSKPVFVTFHGFEGTLPIPKRILFERKVTELLTKGNISIGDYIPKWYGTKASFISYGGLDIPSLPPAENTDYDGAVFIGRLEKDTGIMTYVDAVKILKTEWNIDLRVDICGDGRLRETVEKIVNENKLNVRLHGFVKNPLDYLNKSKFAFVSGYLAILEAMINRKLVFAVYENELKRDYLTLIPGSKDMMVITSVPVELAGKVADYYNNPAEAREKVENAYSFAKGQPWEKVADTYLKLWGVEG